LLCREAESTITKDHTSKYEEEKDWAAKRRAEQLRQSGTEEL
jgi:hypothetical protein